MATQREASTFIRYQLEQLGSRNAHHDFEHVCRQYARSRIDSSVLPATGPVSKGGDQGRDFESLVTFTGRDNTGQRNVFACTTQQGNLFTKLKTDLQTIRDGGSVGAVYFFCVADVAVAERHKWQIWALERLGICLDVIDGQALSEHLADPDLAWIAEEYLNISRKHLPERHQTETGYGKLCSKWEESENIIVSFDEFLEVRFCIRLTTREPREHVSDAPKWLSLMRRLVDDTLPGHGVWRRAVYEYLVGSFYHKQDIPGGAPLVHDYMRELPEASNDCDPDALRDYFTVANAALATRDPIIHVETVRDWVARIRSLASEALTGEERPSKRCGYYFVLYLISLSDPERAPRDALDEAIAILRNLINLADHARFYDFHTLAQAVSMASPMFEGRSDFGEVTSLLDEIVAKRFGGRVAAELCDTRARKLVEADHLCAAIRESHKAKAGWFSGHAVESCVESFRSLSLMYLQAGLYVAALHQAQAGFALCAESRQVGAIALLSELAHLVAECRHHLGQSYELIQAAEVALSLPQIPDTTQETLVRYLTAVAIIEQVEPRLGRAIRGRWESHPMKDSFRSDYNTSMARLMATQVLNDSASAAYFTDCGRNRVLEWRANGARWRISSANSPAAIVAAEELASLLQIIHADMFNRHPWHHVDLIDIRVAIAEYATSVDFAQQGAVIHAHVGEDWSAASPEQLAEALAQLVVVVFIKNDPSDFLGSSVKDGLLGKLFAVAPYAVLRRTALLGKRVRVVRSTELAKRAFSDLPEPHPNLELRSSRLPGHAGQEWDDAIMHRYLAWISKLGPSLRALRNEPLVTEVVARWRAAGVPEWHMLGALGSLLATAAFEDEHGKGSSQARSADVSEFFASLPKGDRVYPLPSDMLDPQTLEDALESYCAAFLVSEGAHVDPDAWDYPRYRAFAEQRLGFGDPGPTPPDWMEERT